MRIFKKILIWVIVICLVAFAGLTIFIGLNGRRIAEMTLYQVFKKPARIGEVRVLFPLGLSLKGLEVEETLEAKAIDVKFGVPLIQNKQLVISTVQVTEPVAVIKRTKQGQIALGQLPVQEKPAESLKAPKKSGSARQEEPRQESWLNTKGILVKSLEITDGKVQFSDLESDKEFKLTIEDLDLKVSTITYPLQSIDIKFDLTAKIFSRNIPFSGSRAQADGWINWLEKNMEGTLKVIEPDGRLGLSADLKSVHNDMSVKGSINLGGKSSESGSSSSQGLSLEGLVLDALGSTGVAMTMDFAFKTKMDDFHIASLNVKGDLGYEGAQKEGGEGIKADLKKIGEQFEDFGKKFYEKNIKPFAE